MIFVTGDCHGNFERFKPEYFPEQAQMTKQDIVICAGDFGGVWFGDSSGCRQSTTVMHTPPITKEMALATAAPMTPHPAPKTVTPQTARVG